MLRLSRGILTGIPIIALVGIIACERTDPSGPTHGPSLDLSVDEGATLIVPTQFPTIQAALDLASPGDKIDVLPGTYVEQLLITKNVTLEGAGAEATFIQAPATLVPFAGSLPGVVINPLEQEVLDALGVPLTPVPLTAIVHVTLGAVVEMSGFTVKGPIPGMCDVAHGRPRVSVHVASGIQVTLGGRLDLSDSRVTQVRDEPLSLCGGGSAIVVGLSNFIVPDGSAGFATIRHVTVDDFQSRGILVVGPSSATVSHNVVTGQGPSLLFQNGIDVRYGAVARITHNRVSGIIGTTIFHGPDPINQFQGSGIIITANPPPGVTPFSFAPAGTIIEDNEVFDNDTGIYLIDAGGCCTTRKNIVTNNRWYGIQIQDGSNDAEDNTISGGQIGIGVIAGGFSNSVNTVARLSGNRISGWSIAAVQEQTCAIFVCDPAFAGFTATAVVGKQ